MSDEHQQPRLPEEEARHRLWRIQMTYHLYWEKDIDRTIGMLRESIALARQLNDDKNVLEMQHWLMQALVFQKKDYKQALPMAVKAAVAVRKPEYADWRTRVCIHQDLIYTYVGIDPDGYASLIEKALDYMEGQLTPNMMCRMCYQGTRAEYEYRRGRLAEARLAALRELSLSNMAHYQAAAYSHLCRIAYVEQRWQELADFAAVYYEKAEADDTMMEMCTALAWQAVAQVQQSGEQTAVSPLIQKARQQAEQLTCVWDSGFYEAMVAYYTLNSDLATAAKLLKRRIDETVGKDAWYEESNARLHYCHLLAQLGQLDEAEIIAAREVARHLKNPTPILAQLDELKPSL